MPVACDTPSCAVVHVRFLCSFFEKVHAQAAEDYIPSVKDILQMRVRTSGIVEEVCAAAVGPPALGTIQLRDASVMPTVLPLLVSQEYIIDNVKFVMYDVGGQRNERKKWIHCFDEVTAVIFVAAISEYDLVLYEDNTQNRMVESLNLFHEICNSKWFENTSIILFLNKKDLFEDKISKVDIRQPDPADPSRMLFDDYEDGCDYDAGVQYIVAQYLAQNEKKDDSKEIYWHVTCATDTSNVSTVFNACKEIILKDNLQGSGFMD